MPRKSERLRLKAQVHLYRYLPDGRTVFLLLQRTPKKDSVWQCVTGKADDGETVEECARREVEEETGLELTGRGVGEVWSFKFEKKGRCFEEHVFGFEACDGDVRLSHEHEAYRWVEAEKAMKMMRFESNIKGLKKVANSLAFEKGPTHE